MGDWEDVFGSAGMAEDFAPWESPCWDDDWEHEYLNDGSYKTVSEWKNVERIIKKGEKGIHLPCANKIVFHKSQTIPKSQILPSKFRGKSIDPDHYFGSFKDAMNWAKKNTGRAISRSPDGKGFIVIK